MNAHPAPHAPRTSRRTVLSWLSGLASAALLGCRSGGTRAGTGAGPGATVDWTPLRERLAGRLVARDDAEFEARRLAMVWNGRKPTRRPAAIVHAQAESDVVEAVRFAADHGLRVAVRGGGHHFDGPVLRDGGLLVDLSGLRALEIDAAARTASVGPGVTGVELIDALAPHGLAFPVGHCPGVALSGFLLSGGLGWNSGAWGPACASVRAADVVTAEGEALRVDAEHHPDLFWAVRGGGLGCPALVVRFHLALHPAAAAIRTSTLVFRGEDAVPVTAWLATVQPTLPHAVELTTLVLTPPAPEGDAGAAPRAPIFVVSATAFASSAAEADAWLAPFEAGPASPAALAATPRVDTPYAALFAGIGAAFPQGHRYVVDHAWAGGEPRDIVASLADAALAPPAPGDLVLMAWEPEPGASAAPLPDMAFTASGRLYVGVYAVSDRPEDDGPNRAWVRRVTDALEPHRTGRYVGEASANRPAQCYPPATWERLAAVRATYDPRGTLFGFEGA